MPDSRDKAVTVLLSPEQIKHLELMVSRGKASTIEDVIARLIDRDRYSDQTPLDGLFGKDESPREDRGDSMWDKL